MLTVADPERDTYFLRMKRYALYKDYHREQFEEHIASGRYMTLNLLVARLLKYGIMYKLK